MTSPAPGVENGKSSPASLSATDVRRVFDTQKAHRAKVAATSARERCEKLERLRQAITARRATIADAMRADFGKAPLETELTEIHPTLAEIRFAQDNLAEWMRPRHVATPMTLMGSAGEIHSEPKGNVLILSPWNYPFNLTMAPLVAAVAAGNVVMLRPSEKTPHTSACMAELLRAVFAPEEVAVFTGGLEIAEAMLKLPFDHIFFTGSTRIGKKVMEAAAQHLASVTLELGGKSPAIVDVKANVELTAERIVWAKFINGGQTCVAPDYVLVPKALRAPLVEAMKRAVEKSYGATAEARRASPDLARMVDAAAFTRLKGISDKAQATGAKLAFGGGADAATRYLEPTIFTDVKPDNVLMEEEIFGPLLPIVDYDRLEDAVAFVNARPKPLALYVFSENSEAVEQVLKQTSSGGACVNNAVIHLGNHHLPFGGIGPSGLGSYHGHFGFKTFSHEKAVLRQGRFSLVKKLYPPYAGASKFLQKVMHWFE